MLYIVDLCSIINKDNHNLPVGRLGIIGVLCPDKCLAHLFGLFYYKNCYFTGGCVWRQKCRRQANVKGHRIL